MSIHIQLSNNSLRDTTASCDSLGIHYEIFVNEENSVCVQKWDSKTNSNVLVGELRFYAVDQDEIRLPGDAQWRPMVDFFKKDKNMFLM
jgi:hypothetical protein